jgi:hypothetical protein
MQPHVTANIRKIRVPIRIESSPGMDTRGFSSSSSGFLCSSPVTAGTVAGCVLNNLIVLGISIDRLAIGAIVGGWQAMELDFNGPMQLDDIDSFLTNFADAFSVDLARTQMDPCHGMNNVQIWLPELEVLDPAPHSGKIIASGHLSVASTTAIAVDPRRLVDFVGSPLLKFLPKGCAILTPR